MTFIAPMLGVALLSLRVVIELSTDSICGIRALMVPRRGCRSDGRVRALTLWAAVPDTGRAYDVARGAAVIVRIDTAVRNSSGPGNADPDASQRVTPVVCRGPADNPSPSSGLFFQRGVAERRRPAQGISAEPTRLAAPAGERRVLARFDMDSSTGPAHDRNGVVVVEADWSPFSRNAAQWAAAEAASRAATLLLVHAYLVPRDGEPEGAEVGEATTGSQVNGSQLLEDVGLRLQVSEERLPDVVVQRAVVRGRTAPSLMHFASGARLIVVGSRGRGPFAGLLSVRPVSPCLPTPVARW